MQGSVVQSTIKLGAPAPPQASPRPHLAFLDGVRGLAALYVVLYHAVYYTGHLAPIPEGLSWPMLALASVLNYGVFAVPVFIVLSGFCLMLPLAQRHTTAIPGGVGPYLRRRAWRILPAYYVALLFALVMIAVAPLLQVAHNTAWDSKVPVTPASLVAHLLLVHNFSADWLYKIDGPMWSVAIEWQIYFLFPLLVLPVLRRTNLLAMLAGVFGLGWLPHLLLPAGSNFDHSHPWFLGLFALGVAGAWVAFTEQPAVIALRNRRSWDWLAGALTLLLIAGLALKKEWMEYHDYLSEPLVGVIVAYLLMRYTITARNGQLKSWMQRLLESRLLVGLGAFSYSLYLIHNPIQALINLSALDIPMSGDARLALMLFGSTTISMLSAYGFYLLVERRCMRLKDRPALGGQSAPLVAHE